MKKNHALTVPFGHLVWVLGFRMYVPFVLLVFQAVNNLPQFNHRYAA